MTRRSLRRLLNVAALGLALGAAWFAFRGASWSEIEASVRRQPPDRLAAVLALTALSFACLAAYDAVAVHVVARGRVPLRVALLGGAAGSAVANTVGFHAVSGTAVRAHLYFPAGLRGAELAGVASLSWLSLVAGNATMLAGAELLGGAGGQAGATHRAIGLALAAFLGLGLAWLARAKRRITVRRFRLRLPSAPLALALMLLGATESAAAIGALYVLLPPDLGAGFGPFAVRCVAAVALGALAHTPGGIGVFEASLSAMLGARGRPDLLAALLLFRLLYNLLPFALAVTALAARGLRRRRGATFPARMRRREKTD